VRGGFIEIAAQDPSQGVVFYRLDQAFAGMPHFQREDGCPTCHWPAGVRECSHAALAVNVTHSRSEAMGGGM
jgi:hypothetical protein